MQGVFLPMQHNLSHNSFRRTQSIVPLLAIMLFAFAMPIHAQALLTNPDGCVTDYDPEVDYFPDKVVFEDATNITVDYFNNYKVVTVTDAYDDADLFQYVLLQCGTPLPANATFPDTTQFVEVPVDRFIALSTTQLPHLVELGQLDALIGLDEFTFVNTPAVREKIDAGELLAVGAGANVNIEMVLDAEPDVVMAFGYNPDTDAHPVLREAGIFTAMNAEWREATPLARSEWIKYTALFFNAEAAATENYTAIKAAYNEAIELVASIPESERPVVLWNRFSPYTDSWTVPGAETYAGALIRDAGGIIALGEQVPLKSQSFSFEVIYDGALDADVWVTNAFALNTLAELLAQDERYIDLNAMQSGNVWNDNLDVNENGGNNYYELGVTNPHLILLDLVAIFHPDLLPDHEFLFYRRLD